MNGSQAVYFDRYSLTNAEIVESHFGCGCKAYKDIFTFDRWMAQGLVVQKGQKGCKVTTYKLIYNTKDEDDPNREVVGKKPWTSVVFCRHQVGKPDPNFKAKKSNGEVKASPTPTPVMPTPEAKAAYVKKVSKPKATANITQEPVSGIREMRITLPDGSTLTGQSAEIWVDQHRPYKGVKPLNPTKLTRNQLGGLKFTFPKSSY